MCGIAGIVGYRGDPIDREELVRIRDRMTHRGPDGAGLEMVAPNVGLAHRRLAIIDLHERAAQPMLLGDRRFVITFNGEIYNYKALRAQLASTGCELKTSSDTEVLLQLYARHGASMLDAIRGMYAFAIWDSANRSLFAARDPHGIKPLYYANDGRWFRFASEVKALLQGSVDDALDPAGLVGFLTLGSVPEPWTCYRGIRMLEAGHWMRVDEGGVTGACFASVADVLRAPASVASNPAETCDALRDSVAHHMVADVPVGAFLSGGVDSGALVALMRESHQEIRSVTIACAEFGGTAADESQIAQSVATRYGTQHETVWITAGDFLTWSPQILGAMDQPTVDGMNSWLVGRAAALAGLKVAVSGLGGDELFGGYGSFREVPRLVAALRFLSHLRLGRATRLGLSVLQPERWGVSPKWASLLEYGGTYPGSYFLRRGLFMPWELPRLIGEELAHEGLRRFRPVEHLGRPLEPMPECEFRRVAILESSFYMRNQLLRDTDWATMDSSLEVRVPLVDFTLLHRLASSIGRGQDGKRTLAECPDPPLPTEVKDRPKTGFGLPLDRWLFQPGTELDDWRRVPQLNAPSCRWPRRLAYCLALRLLERTGVARPAVP